MEAVYEDRYWDSPDGLSLHFRDYAGSPESLPAICLHGFTRNCRDFSEVAARLAPARRVIVPDMRGRSASEYAKDSATYHPATYVGDVLGLLAQEKIDRFIAIGTSMGGIMIMLLAAVDARRIAAAALNDIGPVVDPAGIERIRDYAGQARSFPTWMHAARAQQALHGAAHPDFGIDDWLDMAKRVMAVQQNGRIGFDYDMAIAEPFHDDDSAAPPDLWPAFEDLAAAPLLVVRGENSDILARDTLGDMVRRHGNTEAVEIPGVGHAPTLAEPEAVAAIDRLLARAA